MTRVACDYHCTYCCLSSACRQRALYRIWQHADLQVICVYELHYDELHYDAGIHHSIPRARTPLKMHASLLESDQHVFSSISCIAIASSYTTCQVPTEVKHCF